MKRMLILYLLSLISIKNSAQAMSDYEITGNVIIASDLKQIICIDCHSDLVGQAVMHYPAEDDCENCHMPNGNEHPQDGVSGFDLGDEMPGLCFLCHEEYAKKNKHAPVEMGECLMCHSAHGSPNKGLLLQAPESAMCGECHDMSLTEQRVKHGPIGDGTCNSCHDPHHSEQTALLKSESPGLCMQCHTKTRLEGGMANQHYPFEDDCSNCHLTHSSEQDHLLNEKMPELCYICHDSEPVLDTTKVLHRVVNDEKGCSNCHSPHAASQDNLLKEASLLDLCGTCHTDTLSRHKKSKVPHPPVVEGECSACHQPHASDNRMLATESSVIDLCGSCHDWHAHSSHPIGEDHKDMRNPNLTVDCLSCHRSHGTEFLHLIPFPTITELCVQCHEQYRR